MTGGNTSASAEGKPQPASYWDLLWIITSGMLLIALILLGEFFSTWDHGIVGWLLQVTRLLLGAVFVLYVPGYLLQAALFPRRDDLDGVERKGLSLGLSVALLALLAMLLDVLPWGLNLWSMLISEMSLLAVLILAAALRRYFTTAPQAYQPQPLPQLGRWWGGLQRVERWLSFAMAAVLLLSGLVVAWVFLAPSTSDYMTEFYILGSEGLAEDFPRDTMEGESLQVTLGVTNRERNPHIYHVEVWVQDAWDGTHRQQVGLINAFGLQVGENKESPVVWKMPWEGQDQRVDFLLFVAGETEPYRRLRLWLDVSASP